MNNTDVFQNSNAKLLDFSNQTANLKCELARSKLNAAKALYDICDCSEDPEALFQNIRECCILSTEHSQKAILYADAKHKLISKEKFQQLRKSHDNSKLQKEQQNAGISILEPEDIAVLNDEINGKSEYFYNQIRYKKFNFDKESARKALDVAEKAYNNLRSYMK